MFSPLESQGAELELQNNDAMPMHAPLQVVGTVKDTVGGAIGDEQMKAEGKARAVRSPCMIASA